MTPHEIKDFSEQPNISIVNKQSIQWEGKMPAILHTGG